MRTAFTYPLFFKASGRMRTFCTAAFMLAAILTGKYSIAKPAADSSVYILDGILFETKQVGIDSTTRTATVILTLTSLHDRPRELKINVFGTQLIDPSRNAYYFSTIMLERVLIRFEDRQNYLHYLLHPKKPAQMTIIVENIPQDVDIIELVKIVFEDSTETGRFLEAYVLTQRK